VGLTRARDRLILCGRLNARTTLDKARGWLPWLAEAFDVRLADTARELIDDQGFAFRRYGADPVRGAAAVASRVVRPECMGDTSPSEMRRVSPRRRTTAVNRC